MKIHTTKRFEKKLLKVPRKIKDLLKIKIQIFIENPFDVRLNNHKLHGSLNSYRSINITGDYRLIYENLGGNTILLIDINTHSELYK